MPETLDILEVQDEVTVWTERIKNADRYYDTWARKFGVNRLEEAYYGFQWEDEGEGAEVDHKKYVFNLIAVAIDVKEPSLLFQNPTFTIKPKPGKSDWDLESASKVAAIRTDIINHFVTDPDQGYLLETSLATRDAFFRFGIIEVGYSTDWMDNPNADKPVLKADKTPLKTQTGEVVKEPPKVPENERIYVKRIPSDRFRVGGIDHQNINKCSWVGYWEYYRTEDLLSKKGIDIEDVSIATSRTSDSVTDEAFSDELDEFLKQGDVTKVWKIFDLRSKRSFYITEGGKKLLFEKKFKRLPLFPLKFRERLRGFYPKPFIYDWVSPQNEINDARESTRLHRKQFIRKYLISNDIDEDELDKLQSNIDGTTIRLNSPTVEGKIKAIENANLGAQHQQSLQITTSDFDNVSGTPAERRGENQKGTATEAKIVDARASIRESKDQISVANWHNSIGREILLQVQERFTSDFWVKALTDIEGDFDEVQEIEKIWKKIDIDALDETTDFEVQMEISSMSPISNEKEKRSFFEFMAVVSNYPHIAMSPGLIREAAVRTGYRNEKVIQTLQRMALLVQTLQLEQLEGAVKQSAQKTGIGGGGDEGNALAQREVAQNTPPAQEEINNQLANQTVVQ